MRQPVPKTPATKSEVCIRSLALSISKFVLDGAAQYIGFDISKKAIAWCQKNITSRNPNFRFYCSDIYNKEYNPRGKVAADQYKFLCKDDSVDLAIAVSVFTHMKPLEVLNYMKEIRRVLKPEGKALLTFFIIDDNIDQHKGAPDGHYDFKYRFNDYFSIDNKIPEIAIGYRENVVQNLISEANLNIDEPIYYGCWSGRKSMLDFQDIIIVKKINQVST